MGTLAVEVKKKRGQKTPRHGPPSLQNGPLKKLKHLGPFGWTLLVLGPPANRLTWAVETGTSRPK